MQTTHFTHLHLHSQYSLLDGAIRLKDLFPRLQELGMNTVALTDHGNLYGSLDFYKKARSYGIKPILGCETYICADRTDRQNRRNYHLVLLAKNQIGWKNLSYLNSMGFLEGFYYNPRIDKKLLREHKEGLIGLSACLGGEVAETLLKNGYEAAKQVALEYQDIFEPGCFYLEVQPNGLEDQEKVNLEWKKLSKETGIPIVATGDCHYVHKSDAKTHEVLMAIQLGKTLNDGKRLRHDVESYYIKSEQEFHQAFSDIPEALENTIKIANSCNVELPFGKTQLPRYSIPEGENLASFLEKVAMEGMNKRFISFERVGKKYDKAQYIDRLKRELLVINSMDFSGYFLIVWDFIRYAKEQKIPVGPGRGSGAGSLVAYALQISDIDPIPYNLLFERFLNPERVSMPDFDIDFCMNRRDEVIKYVSNKYGHDRVGQIITYGSLSAKSAIKDVGRVMGLPFSELNELTRNLPSLVDGHPVTMQWAIQNEPKFKQAITEKPIYKEVLDIAQSLEGLHRSVGMHAAGIVIADGPLWEKIPCSRGQQNEIVTQFAKDEVEEVGLVKFDFLGLKTLTVIQQAIELIKKHTPEFAILDIPLDDPKVYKLVSSGNTVGVFQMESSGFTDMVMRLKPDCFEDIIAAGALYRPGPLEGGMVDDFISRKHGKTPIRYHHPKMEPILKETYGVIVYQEQVMQIARELAGYTLGGADLLRRAMGKKKKEVMDQEKAKFVEGAKQINVPTQLASEVFDLMAAFAGYGFNKSHSAAYGLLTYQTAYLKAHYPHEFMASLLSCDKDDIDKIVKNVQAARELQIEVLPPDINQSESDFSVVTLGNKNNQKAIRFGLSAIKGVGETAVEALLDVQKQGHTFSSLFELCEHVDLRRMNRKTLESMIKSGAADPIIPSRAAALAALDLAIEHGQKTQQERASGQTSLFSLFGNDSQSPSTNHRPDYPNIDEFSSKQKLALEKETLGCYISGHPLHRYASTLKRATTKTTQEIIEKVDRGEVLLGGIITHLSEKIPKSGNGKMAFFSLEDLYGSIEVICFPKVHAEYEQMLKMDEPVLIKGLLVCEGDGDSVQKKVHVRSITLLSHWQLEHAKTLVLFSNADDLSADIATKLKQILERYQGNIPTKLVLSKASQWKVTATLPCKVQPSEELLHDLERLETLKVHLG